MAEAVVLAVVSGGAIWHRHCDSGPTGSRGELPASVATAPPRADPLLPLREWDSRRAAAYAAGDDEALAALYLPDAAAGAVDRRLLRSYRRRGLVVREMRTQILAARVLLARDDRLVLLVTDRLERAVAVGRGLRIRLPAERPLTRRVVLQRREACWRVASARQASPAAMTSRTS